jgi:hypothetical protein
VFENEAKQKPRFLLCVLKKFREGLFQQTVSTFDKPDVFKRGRWGYYRIPAGTVLPAGLVIVKDRFNRMLGATHYTIAPAHDMPLARFRALLNQLAAQLRNEVA